MLYRVIPTLHATLTAPAIEIDSVTMDTNYNCRGAITLRKGLGHGFGLQESFGFQTLPDGGGLRAHIVHKQSCFDRRSEPKLARRLRRFGGSLCTDEKGHGCNHGSAITSGRRARWYDQRSGAASFKALPTKYSQSRGESHILCKVALRPRSDMLAMSRYASQLQYHMHNMDDMYEAQRLSPRNKTLLAMRSPPRPTGPNVAMLFAS